MVRDSPRQQSQEHKNQCCHPGQLHGPDPYASHPGLVWPETLCFSGHSPPAPTRQSTSCSTLACFEMVSLTGRMLTSSRVSERLLHRSHRTPPLHFQKYDKQLPLDHPAGRYCFARSANRCKLDTQGRGICCLHSRRILELDTRGIRTRIARTFTLSKRSHVCVRAGGVCARRALPTQVPLSLRNRAKRSPHARTRWRKHPCKLVPQSSWRSSSGHCCRKRGPVLARSLLSQPWETTVFSLTEKTVGPATIFQIVSFVLPKALTPY